MTGATSKCICGVQPPENDLTTIFVCYFLHVRSSVASHVVRSFIMEKVYPNKAYFYLYLYLVIVI